MEPRWFAGRYLVDVEGIELNFVHKPTQAEIDKQLALVKAVAEREEVEDIEDIEDVKAERDRLKDKVKQFEVENETLEKQLIDIKPKEVSR